MKISLFALPLAAILASQLSVRAAEYSASSAGAKASRQSVPTIAFLRPVKGEHFYDYPVYIQVQVSGYHLVPPEKRSGSAALANTGYIIYSMDDFPVYATDDTQIMIGKFLGNRYVPVGWHVLKAELVDVNNHPLNPPVNVATSVFTGHDATAETDHAQTGSQQAENVAQELYKMNQQLHELQKELRRIREGQSGFIPTPAVSGVHSGE